MDICEYDVSFSFCFHKKYLKSEYFYKILSLYIIAHWCVMIAQEHGDYFWNLLLPICKYIIRSKDCMPLPCWTSVSLHLFLHYSSAGSLSNSPPADQEFSSFTMVCSVSPLWPVMFDKDAIKCTLQKGVWPHGVIKKNIFPRFLLCFRKKKRQRPGLQLRTEFRGLKRIQSIKESWNFFFFWELLSVLWHSVWDGEETAD